MILEERFIWLMVLEAERFTRMLCHTLVEGIIRRGSHFLPDHLSKVPFLSTIILGIKFPIDELWRPRSSHSIASFHVAQRIK